ncbi:MAG: histidine kinase [Nitrospirae bacterium GWC2_42_7]|nr:MAG: histidine kinase [Nitrospirae bacterium GWC2_42_7]
MKKVLIVDDEPVILTALSHLLSNKNTTIITSSVMEEAEEALKRYHFDLVIADIRLSGVHGIEGLELLSYIKQLNPKTHVIIMTAYGSEEIKEDAYRRGAFYYFEKPIDIAHLISKVSEVGINMQDI